MSVTFRGEKLKVIYSEYASGHNLAVALLDQSVGIIYAVLTKNIIGAVLTDKKTCAFVDVNNIPEIEKWLKENNLAEPTGTVAVSGYCTYPEYIFKEVACKSKK